MPNRNKEFAELYREMISAAHSGEHGLETNQIHIESALCHLIERYHEEIPPVEDDYFHKAFRQVDVIIDDRAPEEFSAAIDMAFWNLLYPCNLFWKAQKKFTDKLKDEESDASN